MPQKVELPLFGNNIKKHKAEYIAQLCRTSLIQNSKFKMKSLMKIVNF
jgi:hypothetical protein